MFVDSKTLGEPKSRYIAVCPRVTPSQMGRKRTRVCLLSLVWCKTRLVIVLLIIDLHTHHAPGPVSFEPVARGNKRKGCSGGLRAATCWMRFSVGPARGPGPGPGPGSWAVVLLHKNEKGRSERRSFSFLVFV